MGAALNIAGDGVQQGKLELDADGPALLLTQGGLGRLEHSVETLVCSRYFKTGTHRPVLSYEKLPQITTKKETQEEDRVSFHKAKCSQILKPPYMQTFSLHGCAHLLKCSCVCVCVCVVTVIVNNSFSIFDTIKNCEPCVSVFKVHIQTKRQCFHSSVKWENLGNSDLEVLLLSRPPDS